MYVKSAMYTLSQQANIKCERHFSGVEKVATQILLFLIHTLKIVHVFPQVIEVKNAAFSTLGYYLETSIIKVT